LRRLSAAALAARTDDELLAALRAEALEALQPGHVDVVAPDQATPDGLRVGLAWDGRDRHVLVLRRDVPWTADELLVAETLANQAALGLARLESERRRVAQAERDHALARAAHALNVSLELHEVLDTLAREAGLAVGGAVSGVYLLDDDGTALATAGHNVPDEWFGYRLEPGAGIAGQVLLTGAPVVTADYAADQSVLRSVRSGVGVPMCWNDELRGALSIGFSEEREVSREDLQVLEAIADLAVVA
jgi:GAF domain-containing protein